LGWFRIARTKTPTLVFASPMLKIGTLAGDGWSWTCLPEDFYKFKSVYIELPMLLIRRRGTYGEVRGEHGEEIISCVESDPDERGLWV
jgi:hypothetical protein